MNSFFEAREAEKNIRDRVKKLNEQRVKTPEFRKALEKSKSLFIKNYSPKQ